MTTFRNRARVPIMLRQPQFPETRSIYRKSNGVSVVQSIVIRKTYESVTDYFSERLHERLKIALAHDDVQIEAPNYYGSVTQAGDYQIAWNSNLKDFPIAQANFEVEVTPFDATNSNCQTCEDATQIVTNDDTFSSTLEEDTTYTLDVKANDNICCFPTVFSITSFNTDYLDSASINSSGILTVHVKASVITTNGAKLVTYRATCPNGNYDEADVIGNLEGTVTGCLAPSAVSIDLVTTDSALINFTEPSPLPDHYSWKLWNVVTNTFVQTGDTPLGGSPIDIASLLPGTDYIFYIRSECSDATSSNYISVSFATGNETHTCGSYSVRVDDPTIPPNGQIQISYNDCNGNRQTVTAITNYINRTFCAQQSGPGSPTYIVVSSSMVYTRITYNGIC